MSDFPRAAHIAQIEAVKAKIKTAGKIHKRDLVRQLHRLQKELVIYDRLRKQVVMPDG